MTVPAVPLVSVIMPVWRPRREWLLAAVSSVMSQERCELELIVVDDGCPEPVAAMLTGIRDPRLRVLRIAHAGQGAALNAGLAEARGRWIRFADSDDVLPPGSTAHLCSLMDGDRLVAYGATQVCDGHLEPRAVIASDLQGAAVEACLLGQFHARHPSMLFPRRAIDAAGCWDTRFVVSADWDFVLRVLEHAQVRGDRQIVTRYRRHGGSVSGTASVAAGEISRGRMLTRYFERHPAQRGSRLERQAWAALHHDRGCAYWAAGEYRRAIIRLARVMRARPAAGSAAVARFFAARLRRLGRRSAGYGARLAQRAQSAVKRMPSSSLKTGS
jgi:glycosyltransferase involved in cell wall biosynthesis